MICVCVRTYVRPTLIITDECMVVGVTRMWLRKSRRLEAPKAPAVTLPSAVFPEKAGTWYIRLRTTYYVCWSVPYDTNFYFV